MEEREVCNGCNFYNEDGIELCNRCKAPKHIKESCTYWSEEKQCIVPEEEKELKAEDRE